MIPPVSPPAPANTQSPLSGPQLEKLKKGAREFEAMLVAQLWKGYQTENPDAEGSSKTLTDIGTQALAQGVAARGGLGFAKMVLHQLAPKDPQ